MDKRDPKLQFAVLTDAEKTSMMAKHGNSNTKSLLWMEESLHHLAWLKP
jgi:hypothetical protein